MKPITTITSPTVVLPRDNVDTDQIIPARFLTTTTQDGLGKHAFADCDARPQHSNPHAQILVAGRNFGCGSSREHASWALLDAGFRAIISSQFADIFRANAIRNGLLPVTVETETHAWLLAHPGSVVTIDLPNQLVTAESSGKTFGFPFDGFAKHCLINGIDELAYLFSFEDEIARFESRTI